jgi:hypothetical protein
VQVSVHGRVSRARGDRQSLVRTGAPLGSDIGAATKVARNQDPAHARPTPAFDLPFAVP